MPYRHCNIRTPLTHDHVSTGQQGHVGDLRVAHLAVQLKRHLGVCQGRRTRGLVERLYGVGVWFVGVASLTGESQAGACDGRGCGLEAGDFFG